MELAVTKRDNTKKATTLRREGILPAVVYGRTHESTPISVDQKTFEKVFNNAGESTVITLTGLGEDKQVLVNEVERHPVSGTILHADFYAIAKGQKVTVSIPLEFNGVSPAVKELGGILTKVLHELEIECEPKDLPRSSEISIAERSAATSSTGSSSATDIIATTSSSSADTSALAGNTRSLTCIWSSSVTS